MQGSEKHGMYGKVASAVKIKSLKRLKHVSRLFIFAASQMKFKQLQTRTSNSIRNDRKTAETYTNTVRKIKQANEQEKGKECLDMEMMRKLIKTLET